MDPKAFTALERFRKLELSRRLPTKDRFMEICWSRQKGSGWQEAVGNIQAGRDGCTETVATVLLGQQNVCLQFQFFFFCTLVGLSDEGCVVAGLPRLDLLHKQRSSVTRGHNQLKLLERERGECEQPRNDRSNIAISCGAYCLLPSLAEVFLMLQEMLERKLLPLFFWSLWGNKISSI